MSPRKYTAAELDRAARADLLTDARFARLQAREGPFWPERDITPESLRRYAQRCREKARSASPHRAALSGSPYRFGAENK